MMFDAISKNEKKPWEKGEVAGSQPEIYRRLPEGYGVYVYEEGSYELGNCRIEIAIDAIPTANIYRNFEKIYSEVNENANGRKVCFFNI